MSCTIAPTGAKPSLTRSVAIAINCARSTGVGFSPTARRFGTTPEARLSTVPTGAMNSGLAALAGLLALMTVAIGCGAPAMARAHSSPAICGPFGDPPAIFIGVVKPDCLHGTLLGPWQDPDGN